jgi:hypothetical protein
MKHQLSWYTGVNALWIGAFSLQTLLVTWIPVDITASGSVIQEFPSARYRSRVVSIFRLGRMSAAPIGSLISGQTIGPWGIT